MAVVGMEVVAIEVCEGIVTMTDDFFWPLPPMSCILT